ncbi:MAG: TAT-variant-translocated molybdopterin oxidoreductase [Verrucomicrobiae bacterium]|nr:TAT-variant-translocated molybdopterin oxidoreductase [Verrucomicrobiae bacterium]
MNPSFLHPPADATGKRYWRSLEETADTPEFREWLEREFPEGASELEMDGMSRRNFLRVMSASLALAGIGLSGCRRPEAHLVPYTKTPEWLVPGRNLRYATFMPRRRGGMPLHVTTYNGRPTKIEGNPLHPCSGGATDTFAQASVLELYDPERSRAYVKNGAASSEAAFFAEIERLRADWAADRGRTLAFLVDGTDSPTRERLRRLLQAKYPEAVWCVEEPLSPGHDVAACEIAYGPGLIPAFQFDKAAVVLSLDCDFLGNEDEGGLAAVRAFTGGRKVEKPGDKMNRLYAVESRYTLTGGMADHRLRMPANQIGAVASALVREISGFASGGKPPVESGASPAWIREAARDLWDHRRRALVVAGLLQPPVVHVLAAMLNEVLGNTGNTVKFIRRERAPAPGLAQLAARIREGKVGTLFILGGNPAYNAPADLGWEKLQGSVKTVIRWGLHEDETSARSAWHVPAAHYLEAWGDGLARDGSLLCAQPMILPLWGGLSEIELLARIAGLPRPEGPEAVRTTFRERAGKGSDAFAFDQAWERFVHDGFLGESAAAFVARRADLRRCADFVAAHPMPAAGEGIELVFAPDASADDGRCLNNAWLQEVPDPVTKLTWENAALVSPATARALGLSSRNVKGVLNSDVVRIALGGRFVEAPVLVAPGHANHSITLPLGYGRWKVGKVGEGSGFNAWALRDGTAGFALGARVERTGRVAKLAVTQEHGAMEGRALVREAPLKIFEEDPECVDKMTDEAHMPPLRSAYEHPKMDAPHQWAMSIDLNRCTGCNACVIACQSENNIPIVGKDQVAKGREMHWIRLDRYYAGSEDDPALLAQPVTCMQCENAPCETVCPVNATVHSEEGLNVMAYNRCVGTRYCSNNCPYKVRRFNFFDYNRRQLDSLYLGPLGSKGVAETVKMQKNPNVTVRMRGVMEKCTFCVQRLEEAKIDQKVKAGASPDVLVPTDSVKTACQQVCPAQAIVFGNQADPKSEVARVKKFPHDYGMLAYLNVRPRVTYLAKLRNPNPRMPGADQVGMSSLAEAHGHGPSASPAAGPPQAPHPAEAGRRP